jgi:hypothetical protein
MNIQLSLMLFHCFGLAGRSSNIVDANLGVLREKIEVLKRKERLQRSSKRESGWNYVGGYDNRFKRDREMSHFFELVGLVCRGFGFTCLAGTVCLFLVSFLFHLIQ